MATYDAIVVGAGIAGLSAADFLQCSGKNVLVVEASGRVGGRIRRVVRGEDMAESGAQLIHSTYDRFHELLHRFDLKKNLRPLEGVMQNHNAKGTPRIIHRDTDMAKDMSLRGMIDAASFMVKYYFLAKKFSQFELTENIPEYDHTSTADAFKGKSRSFVESIVDPLTYSQANSVASTVSLYYTVNAFRLKMTSSVHGLIGGNATLPEAMAKTLNVRLNTPVRRVITEGGAAVGIELSDGEILRAKHVILACTAGVAGELLPDDFGAEKDFLTNFTHTALPLVYFFLDRPLRSPAAAFFRKPSPGAVYRMAMDHAKFGKHLVPSGRSIISAWPQHPDSTRLMMESDQTIIEQARKDMEYFIPGFSDYIEEVQLERHDWGVARMEPGIHQKLIDFKAKAESYDGLSFAGTDYNTIHMESGVRSGQAAGRRALMQAA